MKAKLPVTKVTLPYAKPVYHATSAGARSYATAHPTFGHFSTREDTVRKCTIIPVAMLFLVLGKSIVRAASTVVLSTNATGNVGILITGGGWNEASHTDRTYQTFEKVHDGPLGMYDFYYQMKIVPQFNPSHGWCSAGIDVGSFFRGLFGVSSAALGVLKATIHYNYTSGQYADFTNTSAPLLMVGFGQQAGGLTPGNGCYFDITPSVEYPLALYEGGGTGQDYDDFDLKFSINGGQALSLNAVATVAGLFSNFNAAFAWSQIKSAEVTAIQSAAQTFQQALASAGTAQVQATADYTLRLMGANQGRLQISLPALFGRQAPQGNLVIYLRRIGSIALDTALTTIDTGSVLSNDRVSARQCSVDNIAAGKCVTQNGSGTRSALASAAAIKQIDSAPPLDIFDPNNPVKQKEIYNLCQAVRTVLIDSFHLSTLDQMMVRWALTKESGLQDALKDPKKLAAIATATQHTANDVVSECWNDGDSKTINGVATALKITLK